MQSLETTYYLTRVLLDHEAEAAAKEATRVDGVLNELRAIVGPRGLGVELRTGTRAGRQCNPFTDDWHRVTLTTPSGGAVVVGQVKEPKDLTIERLHEIVGTPFFVRSVDTLAAQAARDAKSEARAGLLALAGLALLICGVIYAVA